MPAHVAFTYTQAEVDLLCNQKKLKLQGTLSARAPSRAVFLKESSSDCISFGPHKTGIYLHAQELQRQALEYRDRLFMNERETVRTNAEEEIGG